MKSKLQAMVAVVLALLLTAPASLPVEAAGATVGKVIPQGTTQVNQTPLEAETTLYAGDQVATPEGGRAMVLLPAGSQIHVGPASALDVERTESGVVTGLQRGTLLARSQPGQSVAVWAANLLVRPEAEAALYQVELATRGAVVAARKGAVRVEGSNRTVRVAEGRALRFEVVEPPQGAVKQEPVGPHANAALSGGQKAAIAIAVAAGVATAIAVPLALDDDDDEVSPSAP